MSDQRQTRSSLGPGAALIGLGVLMGVQELRAFLALVTFRLYDTGGIPPAATATIALAVVSVGLAGGFVARRGWLRALRVVTGLLAITRVAEQLVRDPAVDLGLATAGTALLFLLLTLALLAAGRETAQRTAVAFSLLLGLAAETAVRTLSGTLDLSWRSDPTAAVAAIAPAAVAMALVTRSASTAREESVLVAHSHGSVALGAWLSLYLLVFSNPANLAARSGMPLERAGGFVLGGALLGLMAAALVQRWGASVWRTVEAAGLAVAGVWVALRPEGDAWFGYLVGPPGMAVLLFGLLAARPRLPRRPFLVGASGIVFLVPTYLWYGRFESPFGLGEEQLSALILGLLVAACIAIAWRSRPEPLPVPGRFLAAGLALAVTVAFIGALTGALTGSLNGALASPPRSSRPAARPTAPARSSLRVMTYNLHQGFDTSGRLDPEALARVIEAEAPDVVALQEVPRGWLVTGGLDLFDWLSRRLGMPGTFAGTADPQWGNAILSRLPLLDVRYHPLPPEDLPLRRGVLEARLEADGGLVRLLCTHLHHRRSERAVRLRQAESLLDIWDGTPATLLLGDLNADPDSAPIRLLRSAGLHDASALLAPERRPTLVRPTHTRHIDWIFATPDLAFEASTVPFSRASDHLPVATTVRPGRGGAAD